MDGQKVLRKNSGGGGEGQRDCEDDWTWTIETDLPIKRGLMSKKSEKQGPAGQ